MGNHYNCSECHNYYEACTCPKASEPKRKPVGQELKEKADALERHKKQEESAIYWLGVRAKAQKLCAEAIDECRAKVSERKLAFGEIYDENVGKKLVEYLKEEQIQAELQYHEGSPSAYLHDDRASYYWVDIKW